MIADHDLHRSSPSVLNIGTTPKRMGRLLCINELIDPAIVSSEGASERSSTNTRFQVFCRTVCNCPGYSGRRYCQNVSPCSDRPYGSADSLQMRGPVLVPVLIRGREARFEAYVPFILGNVVPPCNHFSALSSIARIYKTVARIILRLRTPYNRIRDELECLLRRETLASQAQDQISFSSDSL
jgi:hypothetical protein